MFPYIEISSKLVPASVFISLFFGVPFSPFGFCSSRLSHFRGMFSNNESHSVSHFSGVLSFNESPYQENESPEGTSEDVSLVEERPGKGASAERGGSGECGRDSIGDEPHTKEVTYTSRKKGRVETS